jgi:3-phenylpropionate/trans-cinnamate dioxygenase ferredoxin reductase component
MAYRTVVVGTDGSPTANIAQRTATSLARAFGARLVLVTAYDPPRIMRPMAESFLEYAVENSRREGVDAETSVEHGEPAETLIRVAERLDADLVVVGNKGMGHPSRFRLGSVAAKVAHGAPCDLLIVDTVRAADRGERGGDSYSHILAATDGSATAAEAVRTAFEFGLLLHAGVTLIYVGDPLIGAVKVEQSAALRPDVLDVTTRVEEGDPADRIVETAEVEDADLVVVGSRGLSGVRRWVLGSVSDRVAHFAQADVLIVKTTEHDVSDLTPGRGAILDVAGRKLAVYRDDAGLLHTLSPRCTHMGCTVAWNEVDRTWDCPCHGSRYLIDGSVLQGPAVKPLARVGEPEAAPAAAPAAASARPARVRRSSERIAVLGAGLAGGTAAVALRQEGFDGELVLVGAETQFPYERPPLSKAFLRGEAPLEDAFVQPPGYWPEQGIDLRLGTTVARVDVDARRLDVVAGEDVPYDRLLLATGARNRRFPIPGLDLPGVLSLRTIEDSARIRAEALPGNRAVIVGAGFIGSEVAASLRQQGVEVTVLDGGAVPLERVLGRDVGAVLEAIHRDHGVDFVFEDRVASFEGDGDGRVAAVTTAGGRRLECDFAVVGVGVEPIVDPVRDTRIGLGDGILVDERCRTNVEGVFAAGDVANHLHPVFGRRIRTEHWQNAIRQARSAAASMLGKDGVYDEIHWFWSDQYDQNLQYTGHAIAWDELVVRGRLEARDFTAFYVQGGRVQAAVTLNRGSDIPAAEALIRSGRPVDPAGLRDEALELTAV